MASTNYEKKYNPTNLLITESGGEKTWDDWNNLSGTNVQSFIKGELEKAIVDFEYDSDSILWGVNALGQRVARSEVNVVKPSYHFNEDNKSIAIYLNGSSTPVSGANYNVNANSSLTAQIKFNWNLVLVVNKKENEFTANAVSYRVFLLNPTTSEKFASNGLELSGLASYSASGFKLDITKLLSKAEINSGSVKVRVVLSYSFIDDANRILDIECVIDSETKLNVKRILLSYENSGILSSSTLTFGLSGIESSDAENFKLLYGVLVNGKSVTGSQVLDGNDPSLVNFNVAQVSGAITKDVLTVNLCARVINNDSTLFSDWLTVSALYQSDDTVIGQSGATVAISYVPETVSNCDSANLFNVLTTDRMLGEMTVHVFKASTKSAIQNIAVDPSSTNYYMKDKMQNYLFKTINLSLNGAEASKTEKYFSYLEMEGINDDNNTIYLVFVVQTGSDESNAEISTFCVPTATGTIVAEKVRAITITNPSNYSELMHVTEGKIIDYSQIASNKKFNQGGVMKELFSSDNLHANIDSTDGMTLDGKYMGFKVSPLGVEPRTANSYLAGDPNIEPTPTTVPINLFKTPVKLQNAGGVLLPNTNEFTIELLLKTYNVNDDDDFILSIGNLRLYPHYLRLWSRDLGYVDGDLEFSEPFVASCANFSKDEITHITITYNRNYKPTTYQDLIYSDLYPGFEKTAENNGPEPSQCLKIYINGVINRSISIDSGQLLDFNKDFSLQIHPSNSNINIYGFRTYNKCLTYDLILRNRISAMASLEEEKLPFLEVNDLLYKSSDYTSNRWAQIYNAGLANTISIKKCLGIADSGYANKNKKYTAKNVMLIVTGNQGPLYYGNKKYKDKNGISNKYHDAAMFIKYAHNDDLANDYASNYNGKFIGIYLALENGYDEYYKALGSSAKRYGGAYNVQFGKFYFIPESKLSLFANIVDNKFYDADATSVWEEISTVDPNDPEKTITTYKTNVKLDFNVDAGLLEIVDKDGKKSYKQKTTKYPEIYNTVMEKVAKKKYVIPTDPSKSEVKKLVGKVNYASSMQSHKLGACDLYAGCYPEAAKDYMGRRAVKEDVFYYFYIKLSDCVPTTGQTEVTFRNVTWDNIDFDKVKFFGIQTWGSGKMDKATFGLNGDYDLEYLNIEGADNKNAATNFKTPWAAQQIWNKDELVNRANPYYSAIAGNYTDPSVYVNLYAGYDKIGGVKVPNYTKGLLIDDETIRYKKPSQDETTKGSDAIEKGPDSWDVAGNAVEEAESKHFVFLEWGDEFTDVNGVKHNKISPIVNSFNSFGRLANYIYAFDFGNLELLRENENLDVQTLKTSIARISESKKYVIAFSGTLATKKKTYNVTEGDVFRWDLLFETFVPAGLYYDTDAKEWETFNIGTEYQEMVNAVNGDETSKYYEVYHTAELNFNAYSNAEDSDFFDKPTSLLTIREGKKHYFLGKGSDASALGSVDQSDVIFEQFRGAFADMFKCAIWAYCDVNSFAYHQAAIRFLSGTDNRAKNIYFVLKGNTYKTATAQAYKLNALSSKIPATEGGHNGYEVEDKTYYIVNPDLKSYKNRNLWTLFQDDLDTIFATDNNGLQSKDYNLLEPIYNNDTIGNWGDSRSGLWYNFDLVFETEIKHHLKRIVDWSINSGAAGNGTVYDESNNLYLSFLKIQKEIIPAVTYNHMSEIYYDTMQTVYKGGKVTTFGSTISGFNDGVFNNNLVSNPESLVHGGCLESEKQFLKKRVALLASYCSDFTSEDTYSAIKPLGKTGGGDQLKIYMKMKDLSFILDFYPNILGNSINDHIRPYADPIVLTYNPNAYLTALSRSGDLYEINRFELSSGLTSRDSIAHTDYFKTVTFTEGVSSVAEFAMNNVSELKYEVPDYKVDGTAVVLSEDDKGINFVPINTDETKPILYMDKIVKNVEILKVPYSKFNKATIDLSACQRLKELDLSYATSTVPITSILLPKSNKLARVTLPGEIQLVSIEYYPSMTNYIADVGIELDKQTWFSFDNDNVNLTSITIDLRNSWALNFVEKYAKIGTINNIVFKNAPAELTITSSLLSLLLNLPKFDFDSKVTLNVSGRIDMTMKEKMAKRWGDVDSSTNKVYCIYDSYSVDKIAFDSTSPTIGATGQTVGFNLTNYDGVNANNIKISNNRLQIDYALSSITGIKVDKATGEFTITPGTAIQGKTATLTITVYKTNGTSMKDTVTVTFGAYKPAAGDIVYSDGSISKSLNTNKDAIGFIFWSKKLEELSEGNKEVYDLRVMAFDSLKAVTKNESLSGIISGLPFGPCGSIKPSTMSQDQSYGTMTKSGQEALFQMFTSADQWHAYYDSNADLATLYKIGSLPFNKPTGPTRNTIKFSSTVPDGASNSNLYCGYYVTKNVHDFVYRTGTNNSSAIINNIKLYLNNFPYTTLTRDNYDTVYTYLSSLNPALLQALFPGYIKTYEWCPTGVEATNETIGEGKWYIPSASEYSYLIHQKLLLIDDGTRNGVEHTEDWGKNGTFFYEGLNLRTLKENLFRTLLTNMKATTLDAYGRLNIEFIKKSIDNLKSSTPVSDDFKNDFSNNVFAYESIYTGGQSSYDYKWNGEASYNWGYGSLNPALSERAIIYPCCRIIKEIELA